MMQVNLISQGYFKRDSKGKVRVWNYETGFDLDTGEAGWRTISGLVDGQKVTSEWKIVKPKNVGRANATTANQQAEFEADAEMIKKIKNGYFSDIKAIDSFDKVKAMLAIKFEDAKLFFETSEYCTQPKLDGIRCLARADGLWTRGFKPILGCDHIIKQLKPFFVDYPDAVLDGELYNHDLKNNFDKIVSLVRKTKPTAEDLAESAEVVEYHVYDMAVCPEDMKNFYGTDPFFSDRITWIMDELANMYATTMVKAVETWRVGSLEEIDKYYEQYLEDGYEGQMVRVNGVYEGKRSKFLIKRKEFLDREFKVMRVEEGLGNWSGHIKRFVIELDDGRECGAGVRGNQATLKALMEKECPDWATVRYFTPTPDGMPRFPVVTDWGWGERND